MASEGDGCTLFARLADDLGEVGMRQQEYQGKSAVVAGHGTHNSHLATASDPHIPAG